MFEKEVRADAKLKNLPTDVLDTLWRYRNPEDDGEKLTLEAVLVALKNDHGIEVSLSTLSEFYKWLRLRRGIETAKARAEQARLELAKAGELDVEAIEQVAQGVFVAQMTDDGNVKAFLALREIKLLERQVADKERRTALNERKMALLEAKAKAFDEAQQRIKQLRESKGSVDEEAQRNAILDKVDEIFGIKK
jgi:hypothetical protein